MAYNKPAVQVYQELLNAGGPANITPDLPACIIGPANNVVGINLNDTVARARSLATTLSTINAPVAQGSDVDWAIPVNVTSSFPGQVIDDASVVATLINPLVSTYSGPATFSGGVATVVDDSNTIGSSGSRNPLLALPWVTTKNHVNVGDLAIIDSAGTPIITFVTAVAPNSGTAANTDITFANNTATTGTVEIYTKFDTSEAIVDWVGTSDRLMIGDVTATTVPYLRDADVSSTDDGYRYAVERELQGFGSSIEVHIGYSASRSDLDGRVLTINNVTDLTNQLGAIDPIDNPLAFGVSLALGASGNAPIHAIAIDQSLSESLGHAAALDLAEGQRLYWMVPLTTDNSIQSLYQAHVNAMSLPTSGNWRVALFNQTIPENFYVLGRPDGGDSDDDGFNENLVEAMASGSTFNLTSGDVGTTNAGDSLNISYLDSGTITEATLTVENASGTFITTTAASPVQGQVRLYVSRTANRQEQAQAIADQSRTWVDRRILNFPGNVRVNTDIVGQEVPGYFLMCAMAGLGSGFPAQTGFTNITVPGIAGLQHGNFYFTENQLDLMAEFGTFLFSQNSRETTPFCRHGLTTDVSVLEFREILKVKNWDFLSYYYRDILSPFIGVWNITPDTLQTIRQTISSGSETLLGRKLPRVGPPLLSYNITQLRQNPNSTDAIDVNIQVAIVSPNNYTNVFLQI